MFNIDFISLPSDLSHLVSTFLISLLPIAELRVSIPVAIEVYKMPIWQAVLISIIGNMAPVTLILLIIPKIHQWLLGQKFIGKIFQHFLIRAEQKFAGSYAKWGLVALAVFVGIPLPMTGAWTGALAAFVFNIPFKKSFFAIFAGVLMAAVIVTLITLFAGGTLRRLIG